MGPQICFDELHLSKHLANYLALDIRKSEVAAHVAVSEARVVEAETVEDRSLKVIHVYGILDHLHP